MNGRRLVSLERSPQDKHILGPFQGQWRAAIRACSLIINRHDVGATGAATECSLLLASMSVISTVSGVASFLKAPPRGF